MRFWAYQFTYSTNLFFFPNLFGNIDDVNSRVQCIQPVSVASLWSYVICDLAVFKKSYSGVSFLNLKIDEVLIFFLLTGQINTYCQNIKEFNAQNLGKLFMAQALQDYNNWRNFAITFNRMNFTVFVLLLKTLYTGKRML